MNARAVLRSVITPSRMGRIVSMPIGVRPMSSRAAEPISTALRWSSVRTTMTDGSLMTIAPLGRQTTVFAFL